MLEQGDKRSPEQRLQNQADIARLFLAGRRQRDIARELNLSDAMVSRDMAEIREEWKQSAIMDFNEIKIQAVLQVDMLLTEALQAWEESKKPRVRVTKTERDGEEPSKQINTEPRAGDPRFLSQALSCIEQRCKILGIGVTKVAPVMPDGETPYPAVGIERYGELLAQARQFEDEKRAQRPDAAPAAGG